MNRLPSIVILLSSCKNIQTLKQIHSQIIRKHSEHDPAIISRFLVLCNSFSALNYAAAVFNRVAKKTLYLYNAVFELHAAHRSPLAEPISLFNRMRQTYPLSPDGYTLTPLLKSCSNECNFPVGSSLHRCVIGYGLDSDVYVQTKLVDFYGKCKKIDDARKVFDEMTDGNVVSWTTMLNGYLGYGDVISARKLFDEMVFNLYGFGFNLLPPLFLPPLYLHLPPHIPPSSTPLT